MSSLGTVQTGFGEAVSFSPSLNNDGNGDLYVAVGIAGPYTSPLSITYNGVSPDEVILDFGSGERNFVYRWEAASAASGSNVLSVSGLDTDRYGYVFVPTNNTTSHRTVASDFVTGTSLSDTVTTVSGDLVLDFFFIQSVVDNSASPDAGQTLAGLVLRNNERGTVAASTEVATTTTTTMGWTWTGSANGNIVLIPLIDSGGDTTPLTGEVTFSTFDLLGEISNVGVTVNPEGELVFSTFDLLGDDFTVYISGFSEMIFGTEITGSVMGQITAVISGVVEFGTEMTLAAASTLQRIAAATLEFGVNLMGAISGGGAVASGRELVRSGAAFVGGVVREVISRIVRRY